MTIDYKVISKTIAFKDILLLTLATDDLLEALDFEAGQYVSIAFRRYAKLSPTRCFTIASSPSSKAIQIAMRISGKFTTAATHLKIGDTVNVQGPFGNFVLYDTPGPIVMLAGGIGITPFMSMLRYAAEFRLNIPIVLLFSNRSAENIPFYDELVSLEQRIPSLKIGFFATNGPVSGRIKSGIINEQYISRLTAQDYANSLYYMCGPPRFMDSMEEKLLNHGVDPNVILSESFSQSSKAEINGRLSTPVLTYGLAFASFAVAVGIIMGLDVRKTVHSLEASGAITHAAPAITTTQIPQDTSSSTTSTPQPSTTNTSNTQTQPSQPMNNNNYYYQPPVSRTS